MNGTAAICQEQVADHGDFGYNNGIRIKCVTIIIYLLTGFGALVEYPTQDKEYSYGTGE